MFNNFLKIIKNELDDPIDKVSVTLLAWSSVQAATSRIHFNSRATCINIIIIIIFEIVIINIIIISFLLLLEELIIVGKLLEK